MVERKRNKKKRNNGEKKKSCTLKAPVKTFLFQFLLFSYLDSDVETIHAATRHSHHHHCGSSRMDTRPTMVVGEEHLETLSTEDEMSHDDRDQNQQRKILWTTFQKGDGASGASLLKWTWRRVPEHNS